MAVYCVVAAGRIGELLPLLNQIPLAKILLGVAVLMALSGRRKASGTPFLNIPIAKLTLIFFALIVVSLLFSFLRSMTLAMIVGGTAASLISFLLIAKAAENWASVRCMLLGQAWAAGVLSLDLAIGYQGVRASNVGGYDPNDLAFVLVSSLPLIAMFAIVSTGKARLAMAGLAAVALVSILLTESRGGFLALIAVLVAFAFFPFIPKDTKQKRRIGVVPRLIALVAVFSITWVSLPGSVRERLLTVFSPSTDYNVTSKDEGRFLVWGRNLPLVLKRPWGYGAASSPAVDGMLAGGRFRAMHNMYLEVLIELGVVGILLFLFCLINSWRFLWRRFRAIGDVAPSPSADREIRLFAWATCISLLAAAISGFFLSLSYSNALWLIISLGGVLSIAGMAASQPAQRKPA
jgi:O-antigen ligase